MKKKQALEKELAIENKFYQNFSVMFPAEIRDMVGVTDKNFQDYTLRWVIRRGELVVEILKDEEGDKK